MIVRSYRPGPSTFILLAILFTIAGLIGCAHTKQDYRLDEEIRRPDTGELVYSKRVRTGSHAQAPDNASGPTTQSVGEHGASTSLAGTHEKPLAAYGIEQRQWIFYGGGTLLLIGAAVSVWLGQRMLAACLASAAGILVIGPTFIDVAAPYIAVAVAVLIIIGLIWLAASLYRNHRENMYGVASSLKLQKEGKPAAEVVAALRETPIARKAKGQS